MWAVGVSVGQRMLETHWSVILSNAANNMGSNTVAVARRCATLIALTDVAAVYIGKITGRQWNTERPHFVHNHANLTFRGPCIVIYSYNESQQDALFLEFILVKYSTCFGQIYCPSSGVSQQCSAIILTLNRRSFAITARTTSTFWSFVEDIGLPERGSSSTFSRPSLKALCHVTHRGRGHLNCLNARSRGF